jgi:hypothetical protein
MIRAIDAAMPAEQIGLTASAPRASTPCTCRFPQLGSSAARSSLAWGWARTTRPAFEVLDFWEATPRSAATERSRRGTPTTCGHTKGDRGAFQGTVAVDDEERSIIKLNATLGYSFLMWFDARSGAQDTEVPGQKDRSCSSATSASSRRATSGGATSLPTFPTTTSPPLVLDSVKFRVTGFSVVRHQDYLDHLVRSACSRRTAQNAHRCRSTRSHDVAAVRKAQSAHYRNIAAMDRDEKIRCGAYVYFSFLRPFAQAAGIADELDWTVPRDIPPPLYEFGSMLEGDNTASNMDGAYYDLIP